MRAKRATPAGLAAPGSRVMPGGEAPRAVRGARRAARDRLARDAALAGAGAAAALVALAWVRAHPRAAALERTNFHGRRVSLAAGPALAVAASTTAALGAGSVPAAAAALVAGVGSGAVGLYDDVVGARAEQKAAKGFAGHLAALRAGRITSGLVKIVGIGAAGLVASTLLTAGRSAARDGARGRGPPSGRARDRSRSRCRNFNEVAAAAAAAGARRGRSGGVVDVLLGAGVIAGTANLVNLLDLRPGRALKAAGAALGAPLLATRAGGLVAGPLGATAALLPADLNEQVMLGDAGANALGALLGVALAERTGRFGRAAALAALAGLTVASERVSFTAVIERTPGLRELDALGRRRGSSSLPHTASSPAGTSAGLDNPRR
jgi:hypothetical protein